MSNEKWDGHENIITFKGGSTLVHTLRRGVGGPKILKMCLRNI